MSNKHERRRTITPMSELPEGSNRQQLVEALGFLLARHWLNELPLSRFARDCKSASSRAEMQRALVAKKI